MEYVSDGLAYADGKMLTALSAAERRICTTANRISDAWEALNEKVDMNRILSGAGKVMVAAGVITVGVTALATAGPLFLPAMGVLLSGGCLSSMLASGVVVVTTIAGGISAGMGISDAIEGVMDIGYGAVKSDEKSVNVVRDVVFGGDEEKYRMVEGIATGIAGAGTAAINNLGLGEKVLNAACFAEGTLVLTSVGLVCIEALCVGDKVYAKDTETGEEGWQTVEQVFERDTDVLTVVTINGETITTTPEHPFYVKGEGWIDAWDLKEGMETELADGGSGIVEAVEVQYLDEPVTVYNMEVAESHTYYVAEVGVLVHNLDGCGPTNTDVTFGSIVDESGKDIKLSSQIEGNSYDINKLQKTQTYTYPENVASIKETIIQNGPNAVPPIEIRVHNGQVLIVDGHHRLEAFYQLGYDRVPIKYLHSSQLGKMLPDGTYYRSLQELLDAAKLSN